MVVILVFQKQQQWPFIDANPYATTYQIERAKSRSWTHSHRMFKNSSNLQSDYGSHYGKQVGVSCTCPYKVTSQATSLN